ncbi:hypothetical protein AS156_16265 [Bradyrhizobium macuxiense]|uniref:Uncharacterized protein n=1 Tax=Bradyrhizobium macuxiense TaxID=1755647 RepID=A0A120FJM5_9BRAD|nr:hypothetical protein AS156_16265 [Bradyrhizobium macuxiense]
MLWSKGEIQFVCPWRVAHKSWGIRGGAKAQNRNSATVVARAILTFFHSLHSSLIVLPTAVAVFASVVATP